MVTPRRMPMPVTPQTVISSSGVERKGIAFIIGETPSDRRGRMLPLAMNAV